MDPAIWFWECEPEPRLALMEVMNAASLRRLFKGVALILKPALILRAVSAWIHDVPCCNAKLREAATRLVVLA